MKMKHILFPIDFSECSRTLNREVEWVANRFDSQVTLLHVFEIPLTWYGTSEVAYISPECLQQVEDDAKQRLTDYPIQLPSSRVERMLAKGDAAWHINDWVNTHEVDLVMMGTHGYGSIRRLFMGSVAMKVLHDVECPVWTHAHPDTDQSTSNAYPSYKGISKILCSLEATGEAVPLLRHLKNLSDDFGSSVQVIHVVPRLEPRTNRYFDTDLHRYLKECAAAAIAEDQQEAGTDFPVRITDGMIGHDTATLASEQKSDLIVIGRGKTQNALGTWRTHAYDIIRQAPCPVLSFACNVPENSRPALKDGAGETVLSRR